MKKLLLLIGILCCCHLASAQAEVYFIHQIHAQGCAIPCMIDINENFSCSIYTGKYKVVTVPQAGPVHIRTYSTNKTIKEDFFDFAVEDGQTYYIMIKPKGFFSGKFVCSLIDRDTFEKKCKYYKEVL